MTKTPGKHGRFFISGWSGFEVFPLGRGLMHAATARNRMNTQSCRTATGFSSEERILRLLRASPEQQEAIDRILSGQWSLDAIALRAAEATKGPLLMMVR